MRFVSRTPVRTFILYPIITLVWEYLYSRGNLHFHPLYLALMLWGYLQYRLCGLYRIEWGGGGPGLETLRSGWFLPDPTLGPETQCISVT